MNRSVSLCAFLSENSVEYESCPTPSWIYHGKSGSVSGLRRSSNGELWPLGGEHAALESVDAKLRMELSCGSMGRIPSTAWDVGLWLEAGCLSPRWMKEKLTAVGKGGGIKPERLKALETELILGDFYRFIALVRAIMNIESALPKERKSIIP